MANPTTNFGWQMPTSTDLVTDLPADFEVFGQAVDTALVDLKGGTTGQVLAKASGTDMDFTWVAQDDSNAIQNAIVDAKGDLIAASAADTPARLAVGNNGETLVADSSTSTGLRYQVPVNVNPVLNSAFQVWQRGTSFASIGTTQYSADRWFYGNGGTSNYTISRQVTGDTTNLPNIQYCARLARASGNTNTAVQYYANVFETINSIPYAGKTITFSYYARVGANWSGTGFAAVTSTGTTTDASFFSGPASNVVANSAPTLTTTWQRFTATGTVGAGATQMAVYFTWTPSGTAGANDYLEITGVQVECGSVATPFKTYAGTIQGELAACQRYYWRNTSGETLAAMSASMPAGSTTEVDHPVVFPVPMRVRPTSLDAGSLSTYDGTTNYTSGTFALIGGRSGTYFATVRYTHGSAALTQYRPYQIIANSSASAFIGFSAEL